MIQYDMIQYDMIYLLTAVGWQQYSTHLHTNSTQNDAKQTIHRTWCTIFASFILAFALQLRKKYGKTSVRVAEECQLAR